jgi:5-methylcytosine-specific restriction endonuclease McrA
MREIILARNKEWAASNPERASEYAKLRRARLLGAEGAHNLSDVMAIWGRQGHKCAVPDCAYPISKSGPNRFTVDHIQPLTRGGSDYAWNLQILCKPHNSQKNNSDPYEWAKRIGLLFPR